MKARSLVFVAVSVLPGLLSAQGTPYWTHGTTHANASYTAPGYTKFSSVSIANVGVAVRFTFTMQAALPTTVPGKMLLQAAYGTQRALVVPLGSYDYPSTPVVPSGSAAVVSAGTWNVTHSATVTISGNQVIVDVPGFLVAGSASPVAFCSYLPAEAGDAAAGALHQYSTSAMPFVPSSSSGTRWFLGSPGVEVPGQVNVDGPFPTKFMGGPPNQTGFKAPPDNDDQVTWETGIGPDGDSGWSYDGTTNDYPGQPGKKVKLFCIGNEFRIGYGNDDDGDGNLDGSEVDAWIGKCGFPDGFQQASGWYQGADGTWYWVHRNFSNNGLQVRVYIYDPVRNKLKVFDENGNLIFFGDPGDFWGW